MSTHDRVPLERDAEDTGDQRARRFRKVEIRDFNSPSRVRTPTSKSGPSPRIPFSRTRTLKDAFDATAPQPPPPAGNSPRNENRYRPPPKFALTRSPHSDVISPPPRELLETYMRISDADNLADLNESAPVSPSPSSRGRYSGWYLRKRHIGDTRLRDG
jgi:hypothetical protein